MTRAAACACMLAFLVSGCRPTDSQTPAPEAAIDSERAAEPAMTADQLVAKVIDARQSTGFAIRATLTHTETGSNIRRVRQLLINGRRDSERSTMLYQQVLPNDVPGPAIVIEDAGDHQLRGFVYRSGEVTQLAPGMLDDPFFDSDVRVEDLTQGFWHWPSRTIVGEEVIGEFRCTIVEFRPGPDTQTTYSLVRAWLSSELAMGLRIEQFGHDGSLMKRIGLFRILKLNDRWLPAIVTVEPADGRSRTVVEGVGFDSDLHLTAADFTADAVIQSVRTAN